MFSDNLRPTIKLDGTSCYVAKFNGKPWLFARHDIRPNKSVARKYKEYQHKKNESWLKNDKLNTGAFVWNLETDYKFPKNWISACNNAGRFLFKSPLAFMLDVSVYMECWKPFL